MKKAIPFLITLLLLSCSEEQENSLTVENRFSQNVTFQFRGESYKLTPGENRLLNDLPVGIYAYKSAIESPVIYQTMVDLIANDTFQIPISLKMEEGENSDGLNGELSFTRGGTHVNVFYGGSVDVSEKKCVVFANITSNISQTPEKVTQ